MATKLRSILRQIPWSLLVKAFLFALGWVVLPFWLFVVLAFGLYFFPFFNVRPLFFPFLYAVFLAGVAPLSFWLAMILGASLFLILGIKEYLFIHRDAAYEVLILILLFASFVTLFARFPSWEHTVLLLALFLVCLTFFFFVNGFLHYVLKREDPEAYRLPGSSSTMQLTILVGVATFLLWQISLGIIFLPISSFFQSALAFFTAVVFVELLLGYFRNALDRKVIYMNFALFFLLAVFIFASNEWGL